MKTIILHLVAIVFIAIITTGDILILNEVIAPLPDTLPAWVGFVIMVCFMVFVVFTMFPVMYTYSHMYDELSNENL